MMARPSWPDAPVTKIVSVMPVVLAVADRYKLSKRDQR
jgi:hypothetical protein